MILENKEEFLLFLLKIKKNETLGFFNKRGYSYSDIVKVIDESEKMGYIKYQNDMFEITYLGEKKINELLNTKRRVVILPLEDKKIKRIDLFDIYVPKK